METIKLIYQYWDVSAVDIIVLFEQYCVNDNEKWYQDVVEKLTLQEIRVIFDMLDDNIQQFLDQVCDLNLNQGIH